MWCTTRTWWRSALRDRTAQIADAFDLIGDILDFQGANPFRVRAYRNGARTIRDYPEPLAAMVETEKEQADATSRASARTWRRRSSRWSTTGSLPMLEELQAQVPESVLALLRMPGVGPKKAAALHKELGITTLDELKAACEAGKVRELKGFGEKTEQMILQGMAIAEQADQRMYWAEADEIVAGAARALRRRARASSSSKSPAATAAARRRSATSIFWSSPPTPTEVMDRLGRVRRHRRRCSPAATPRCRSAWPAACRSICASCRPSRSARRCSTSPARRSTTSSSAAWPRTRA